MTAQVLVPRTGHPSRPRLPRPMIGVLLVPALLTLLVVLALAGAARDDAAIDARTAEATAEVLAVGPVRTVVVFTLANGQILSPVEGIAYPSGLRVGQLVRVEYDAANPEVVRVAGRDWTVGLVPGAVLVGLGWAVCLPVGWWLGHRRRT